MRNYKIDEAKFLADYLAIEGSRAEKIVEAEGVLAELSDRMKRLQPETIAQIKADIHADIDKEIGEQRAFYDKYIVIEEIDEIKAVDEGVVVVEEIVETTTYDAIQITTEPVDMSGITFTAVENTTEI